MGRSSINITRKKFLGIIGGGIAMAALWDYFFSQSPKEVDFISGVDLAKRGHTLRDSKQHEFPIDHEFTTDVVIVGGGISGLSAARKLKNVGIDFKLLELNDKPGGNSAGGENKISKYPYGAHYLPIANEKDTELIQFLKELGVITHFNNEGLPYYHENYLCSEPEERVFFKNRWHEGLIPSSGLSKEDDKQITQFISFTNSLLFEKGKDGKDVFCFPLANCSQDENWLKLDRITFIDYLKGNGYTSQALFTYLNYCMKDDYGTTIEKVSAWAGLHYFCARKGKAANAESGDVLTWPQGNQFLADGLSKQIIENFICGAIVTKIEIDSYKKVNVIYQEHGSNKFIKVKCNQVILATPQMVNKRLLPELPIHQDHYPSYPWLVANLTVEALEEKGGMPLSWDNVLFESPSLGFVNACHQKIRNDNRYYVLTYYLPFCQLTAKEERLKIAEYTQKDWEEIIISDLSAAYPNIKEKLISVDVKVWGHAMIAPERNIIHNKDRKQHTHLNPQLVFAHTDLSGISVFEEAFWQGNQAAQTIINLYKKHEV